MESVPGADLAQRVFSYTVAEKAPLYLSVVEALMQAKERFRLQLRPAELTHGVEGAGTDEVTEALEALYNWGNVTRFYDPSAPETLDQFYAKRFLYQLTEAGVAAHEGVRAVRRVGLDTGRLSGVLLPAIVDGLKAVNAEASQPAPDAARLYSLLLALFASFSELAENAARYMDALAVEVATITSDDSSFLSYKRAVFTYLDEFVGRLTEKVPEIAATIQELDPGMSRIIELAARADEAPVRDGEDDGPWRSLAERWSGVRAWFVRRGDDAPISEPLRLAMLDAINRILAAVERLHERHLRRVSRESDFVQLARWFATMGDDEAATLWDQAFGLWGARHFSELAGDEEAERGRSFWEAEPAQVAPRLRTSGARGGPGRPSKAASYAETKALGVAQARQTLHQADLALTRLAGMTPLRLSDLGSLGSDEFSALLSVIDAALGTPPGKGGARWVSTALVKVKLHPPPDKKTAVIKTPAGVLRCDDYFLEIELTSQLSARRRALGAG